MQESFWRCLPLPSPPYPLAPFSPSLISLTVSVDVKHHVYLFAAYAWGLRGEFTPCILCGRRKQLLLVEGPGSQELAESTSTSLHMHEDWLGVGTPEPASSGVSSLAGLECICSVHFFLNFFSSFFFFKYCFVNPLPSDITLLTLCVQILFC